MFRYYGRKMKLAPWIVSHYPRGDTRLIDAFGGSGEVLCRSPKHSNEHLNEINPNIVAVYRQVQSNVTALVARLMKIRWTADDFYYWRAYRPADEFHTAIREFVTRSMSFNGQGSTYSTDTRFPHNDAARWIYAICKLPTYSRRLQGVEITNFNSLKLIEQFRDPTDFFYLDPPYMHETRNGLGSYETTGEGKEMADADHVTLLRACLSSPAKFLISGYASLTYDYLLRDWNRVERIVNSSSGRSHAHATKTRTEVLWRNY